MKSTIRNIAVLLAAILAVALLLGRRLSTPDSDGRPAAASRELEVQALILHSERLHETVATVGTLLANEEVEVRSQVSGQLRQIGFTEGGLVQAGQLLAKIDDGELQAQRQRAVARQAIAQQQADRQRQLLARQVASEEDYALVASELDMANAELRLIQAQIERTEIRAPFAGHVGLRHVSAGSYLSPATVITSLHDRSQVKVDFSVPERYAGDVAVGDRVRFRVQARPDPFEGQIESIDVRVEPSTRTLRLRALAANPAGVLLPGAFAHVELVLRERDALTLPAYALVPDLGGHHVWVYRDGTAATQAVLIGTRTGERVEVIQGLAAGDTVLTSALLQLRPGLAVRPTLATAGDRR